MGRKRIWGERTVARLPDGTLARIAAALAPGESQTAFIARAVEHELVVRAWQATQQRPAEAPEPEPEPKPAKRRT